MKYIYRLKNALLRGMVYAVVIFLCIQQLNDFKEYSSRFSESVLENMKKLNADGKMIKKAKDIFKSPDFPLYYSIGLYIGIAFASLSILVGCFLFKLPTSIFFFALTIVNFSPFLPENKTQSDNKYGIRKEFIICTGIFIGMIALCFKCNEEEKKVEEESPSETSTSKDQEKKKQKKKDETGKKKKR